MMNFRLQLCFVAFLGLTACVSAPSPVPVAVKLDDNDKAYLALRSKDDGCLGSDDGDACCAALRERMEAAFVSKRLPEVEVALDAMAISCPRLRNEAVASLKRVRTEFAQPAFDTKDGPLPVSVYLQVDIPDEDRVFWASAYFDGKASFHSDPLEPGPHTLEVEFHVLSDASREPKLVRVRATKEFQADSTVRQFDVTLRKSDQLGGDGPYSVGIVTRREGDGGPAFRVAPPSSFKLKTGGQIRPPAEFRTAEGVSTASRVCVDPDGKPLFVTPGRSMHPRYAGVLLDFFRRAAFYPVLKEGTSVPARGAIFVRFVAQ